MDQSSLLSTLILGPLVSVYLHVSNCGITMSTQAGEGFPVLSLASQLSKNISASTNTGIRIVIENMISIRILVQ